MTSEQARIVGKKGGRPKGSLSKPRLADFLTKSDVQELVGKALELAKIGNAEMLKFVLDHNFGKAPQSIDHTTLGKELPVPMYNGLAK